MDNLEKVNREIHKRKSLSLGEKLNILESINAGRTIANLAEEYQVSKSTIFKINKTKSYILEQKKSIETYGGNFNKKKFKGTRNDTVDKAIFQWFTQQQNLGVPVSGPVLKTKALYFNKLLGGPDDFKASVGWLCSFKKRYGIRCVRIQGEKTSTNLTANEEFRKNLKMFMDVSGIGPDFIYNCDETGLYWKELPNTTLIQKSETYSGGRKLPRDRVTVMTCTNATGTHKIPLLIIGKYEKPCCFKNINTLPVLYRHQRNAWMDKPLMMDWYRNVFIPDVKKRHSIDMNENIKIVLIMDNAPCHLSEDEFNAECDFCTVMFLPPNITALIQPMDQGIIKNFKTYYKELFLKRLNAEVSKSVEKTVRSFIILDCCIYSAIAWDRVSETTIRNSWRHLITLEDDSIPIIENNISRIQLLLLNIPELNGVSLNDVNVWLNLDNNLPGWQLRSDNEIAYGTFSDVNDENSTDEDFNDVDVNISPKEALKGVSLLINWLQNNISFDVNTTLLEQYRFFIYEKMISTE